MSTQPDETEIERGQIEATGDVTGDIATVDVKLGTARLVLTFQVGEEGSEDADTLYAAFPAAMEQVIVAIEEAQAAEESERG